MLAHEALARLLLASSPLCAGSAIPPVSHEKLTKFRQHTSVDPRSRTSEVRSGPNSLTGETPGITIPAKFHVDKVWQIRVVRVLNPRLPHAWPGRNTPSLSVVIRLAREYRGGTVQLLRQDDPHQLMRHRHR